MSVRSYPVLAANDALTLGMAETTDQRAALLKFIRGRFLGHFGADIEDDTPVLVGAFDRHGALTAAFGLRSHLDGFFCEHYLAAPLESELAQHLGCDVGRQEIVELTHLCAVRAGTLGRLITLLPGALTSRGYRYLACTATACLATYFDRRGLRSVMLAEATDAALPPDQRSRWGTYYAASPRVLAGDIGQAAGADTHYVLAAGG